MGHLGASPLIASVSYYLPTLCVCTLYVCPTLFTMSGVGEFLKSKNPDIQVVLADPQVHCTCIYMYNVHV